MRAERDRWPALVCLGVAWMLAGCAHDAATRDATPVRPVRAVATRVDTNTFALSLSAPEVLPVGTAAAASLTIEGRGDYHVNDAYPMRIRLRSSGAVTLPRDELAETDAAELSEQRARFELPFTCRAAGAHRLEVDLEFALCTATTCIPETRSVALELRATP